MQSEHVQVRIDLGKVRENVAAIARKTGVDVIAVIKSDGYGLGAREVAEAIADLVWGFCVFSLKEAKAVGIWQLTRKPTISLGPSTGFEVEEFLAERIHPSVWTVEEAKRLRTAKPILGVDTGMQRFSCPAENVSAVIAAGEIREAFTHATRLEHVELLKSIVKGQVPRLHAAASALLDEPAAWLNAVRPGMAMYRGAAHISARLIEVRNGKGPAGYSGFVADRFGIILCGYSHGVRRGPYLVNGTQRKILEVGMQTSFVEIGPGDKNGDEAVLLGDELTEAEIGTAWQASEQQVLSTLASAGIRTYVKT